MMINQLVLHSLLVFGISVNGVTITENHRPTAEGVPHLPPAITSDELHRRLDVDDIVWRRRMGLEIPNSYYAQCHFWINAVRAREGLPALHRWKEMESCSDEMSEYDFAQYRDFRRPHAAFQDNVGCHFGEAGVNTWGQNSCPMWENSVDSVERCTVMMWDEKVTPGVNPSTLECLNGVRSDCGHYYNLRGGDGPGAYNKFNRVACGFYVDPVTEDLYINQNFGGGGADSGFLCGGDADTKPQGNLVVDDCVEASPDYSGCSGISGVADPEYFQYGCSFRHCDPDYDGPCENLPANGFDACNHFGINEPADCGGHFFFDSNGPQFNFVDFCRASCNTCACDGSVETSRTRAPTPPPTAPCDETFDGECVDVEFQGMQVCEMLNINGNCSPNHTFTTGDGVDHSVLDHCRKSCQACSCGLDAPTPKPVASPTPRPVASPTPRPVASPTPSGETDPVCRNMVTGFPKGKKKMVQGAVLSACTCEEECSGNAAFVHMEKSKKCWCMAKVKTAKGKVKTSKGKKAKKSKYGLLESVSD